MNAIASSTTSPVSHQHTMAFSQALDAVLDGNAITKLDWDDKSIYGAIRDSVLMLYRDGEWFQWIINEGDLLGTDWVIRTE